MTLSNEILSDITIYCKYAKYIPELKRRETWNEIIDRNKGMHLKKFPNLKDEIEESYKFVYDKKILPSMRSLQFSGKAAELNPARLYNCTYAPIDDWEVFSEIMFLLLSGCGVGYSVQDCHVKKLPEIKKPKRTRRFLVNDSIEGWAEAVKVLLKAYFLGRGIPIFDFSDVRPKGTLLKTSGGKAPGPEPLIDCLHNVKKVMDRKEAGDKLTPIEAHDILCYIADAVLAGGIRRSAMVSLFSIDNEEMLTCKYGNWWELNPQRARANNSATILRHRIKKKEFLNLWKKIELSKSGEPGIYFSNDRDVGSNPCLEIALIAFCFCNLVEVNVSNLESQEDYNARCKAAAFIATLQASYTDFHYLRDCWKEAAEKDALIGVSMTGIASGNVLKYNEEEAANIVVEENARVAKLIGINKAARCTTIKPAGTTSLVLGCSSGIHAWHSKYYIRRITLLKNEPLYLYLAKTNKKLIEDDPLKPSQQALICIPQKAPDKAIIRDNEEALDLLERIKRYYNNWVVPGHRKGSNTNNVSATISIKENDWESVGEWMWDNRDSYNGLSVLPYFDSTYVQAPFESITKEKYEEMENLLKEIDLTKVLEYEDNTSQKEQIACSGGKCDLV